MKQIIVKKWRSIDSPLFKIGFRLQDPVVAFVWLSVLFGIIFCFVTPPFFVLDESLHFSHAYQVSQGQSKAHKLSDKYYGADVPKYVDDGVLKSLLYRTNKPHFRTTYIDNFRGSGTARNPDVKVQSIFNSVAVYTPVPYLPQAFGIGIGRILHLPVVWLMYLGRLCNLLVWIVLVALAVRLLPFGKWALVVVALLPTSIFQAASLSADALTTGLAFVGAALIFKLAMDKKLLQTKQYLLICVIMILLALTKQSYLCFALLIFALPRSKFRSSLQYWTKTSAVVVLSLLPAALWSWSVRKIDIMLPVLPNHPPIDTAAQLHNVILHPQHYAFATWSSYLTGRTDTTISTFIGQFGRIYDLKLPLLVVLFAYLLIFVAMMSDEAIIAFKNRARLKVVSGLVLVLTVLALTSILYITYNTVNHHFVDGIQARYFLPLMILLIPLAKLRQSKLLRIQAKPILFPVCSTLLLIISVLMMAHRFYYALA